MKHQIFVERNILTAGFAVVYAILGATGIALRLRDPLNPGFFDAAPE